MRQKKLLFAVKRWHKSTAKYDLNKRKQKQEMVENSSNIGLSIRSRTSLRTKQYHKIIQQERCRATSTLTVFHMVVHSQTAPDTFFWSILCVPVYFLAFLHFLARFYYLKY